MVKAHGVQHLFQSVLGPGKAGYRLRGRILRQVVVADRHQLAGQTAQLVVVPGGGMRKHGEIVVNGDLARRLQDLEIGRNAAFKCFAHSQSSLSFQIISILPYPVMIGNNYFSWDGYKHNVFNISYYKQ